MAEASAAAAARAPKRRRGHLRVAAILTAGAAVFAERGYDAATMTEIAARAGAAIGSLYRFFPSKEALADALLLQYQEDVAKELTALDARAAGLSIGDLVDALIAFRLSLHARRRAAASLADARGGGVQMRKSLRHALLSHIGGLLRIVAGAAPDRADAMAPVVLHLLQGVSDGGADNPATRDRVKGEFREALRLYLTAASLPGSDTEPVP